MLKSKKLLNATLRAELEGLDNDPDIIEMQTEAFRALQKTTRKIVEILYREIGRNLRDSHGIR